MFAVAWLGLLYCGPVLSPNSQTVEWSTKSELSPNIRLFRNARDADDMKLLLETIRNYKDLQIIELSQRMLDELIIIKLQNNVRNYAQ